MSGKVFWKGVVLERYTPLGGACYASSVKSPYTVKGRRGSALGVLLLSVVFVLAGCGASTKANSHPQATSTRPGGTTTSTTNKPAGGLSSKSSLGLTASEQRLAGKIGLSPADFPSGWKVSPKSPGKLSPLPSCAFPPHVSLAGPVYSVPVENATASSSSSGVPSSAPQGAGTQGTGTGTSASAPSTPSGTGAAPGLPGAYYLADSAVWFAVTPSSASAFVSYLGTNAGMSCIKKSAGLSTSVVRHPLSLPGASKVTSYALSHGGGQFVVNGIFVFFSKDNVAAEAMFVAIGGIVSPSVETAALSRMVSAA